MLVGHKAVDMVQKLDHVCKICDETFSTEKSLHAHIKKHKIFLPEYYVTFYPRKNLLTGQQIPFKDKNQYFSTYFSNADEMEEWLRDAPQEKAQEVILSSLENRIKTKGLKYAPTHLELRLHDLPKIETFRKYFSSYNEACKRLQVEPLLNQGINAKFLKENKNLKNIEILIDTREQQPLKFEKSKSQKLDFGDYTASGEFYSNTYIDRKSETDFKSTMTVGFERFKRELERAGAFNSFLYVVIESSVERIIKNNDYGPHRSNMAYVWHQMRILSHEFPRKCQFIFSGGRNRSEKLIPLLLYAGEEMWNSDIQYYIDNRILIL